MGMCPSRLKAIRPSLCVTLSVAYREALFSYLKGAWDEDPLGSTTRSPVDFWFDAGAPTRAGGPVAVSYLERATGIEPVSKAWEAFVLPLNYARLHSQYYGSFPLSALTMTLEASPRLLRLCGLQKPERGSSPFDRMRGAVVGAASNRMNAAAASGSLACAPTPAVKTT